MAITCSCLCSEISAPSAFLKFQYCRISNSVGLGDREFRRKDLRKDLVIGYAQ